MEETLSLMSFSPAQIEYVDKLAQKKLHDALSNQEAILAEKKSALREMSKKITSLEEKFLEDQIESTTYNKWFRKYSAEISIIKEEIARLNGDHTDKWKKFKSLLPHLENLSSIFKKATVFQKQNC